MYINRVSLARVMNLRSARAPRTGDQCRGDIVAMAWHADPVAEQRSVFGRVTLVSGPEALLADRAVDQVIARARAEDPQVEIAEIEAARLDFASLV